MPDLGAYVSYYMMHNLFGVFSLLIPVFGITVAIKLFLDDPRAIRLWKVLIHLTIIMPWVVWIWVFCARSILAAVDCASFAF